MNTDEAIADLQRWRATTEERFRTMPDDVRELRGDMAELKTDLKLLVQREHARKECPNPGLCLNLEPRISTLENWRNIVVGGALVTWLVICVTSIVAYDWIKAHFDLMKR